MLPVATTTAWPQPGRVCLEVKGRPLREIRLDDFVDHQPRSEALGCFCMLSTNSGPVLPSGKPG